MRRVSKDPPSRALYAAACAVALLASAASAQVATPAPREPAATDQPPSDEIVVTGSHIKQSDPTTTLPISVMTASAIEARGVVNAADAINQLPQVGTPESNRGSQGENVGKNYINLLGLGSQRTLTLVNGHRFVSSNPAAAGTSTPGSQVDFNDIPVGLIDHVEILQATGASIYGSDAIAGVVNVILKSHFSGLQLDAQSGISPRGDSFAYSVRGTAGTDFAEGRGNFAVNFERSANKGLNATERAVTGDNWVFARNPANQTASDGIPASILLPNRRVPEVTVDGIPFVTDSSALFSILTIPDPSKPGQTVKAQFSPLGDLVPYDAGIYYSPSVATGGQGLDLSSTFNLISPIKRNVLYAIGSYELGDHLRFHAEGTAAWVKGIQLINQGSLFNGPLFSGAQVALSIDANNAFLSDQARSVLQAEGVSTFYLSRFNADLIPSTDTIASGNTQRALGELDGDFSIGSHEFTWSASASYGHSGGSDTSYSIVSQRLLYAVDAVRASDGSIDCNVTLQNPASADPNIRQCVPIDVFGSNHASEAAKAYVSQLLVRTYDNVQTDFQPVLSGDIAKLPGGLVRISIGYEHRGETAKYRTNDAAQSGITRAGTILPIAGRYNTDEFFGEVSLPIFGRAFTLPLIRSLDLDASARHVDNSIAGKDHAWSFGGRWSPLAGVVLRGSKSRTFRAPSMVELFQPRTTSNESIGGDDPCDYRNIASGNDPSAREKNCKALFASLGLPANFQLTSNAQNLGIPTSTGGNPNLRNEVASSWTYGVVVTPKFFPGFNVSADYVHIDISRAIVTFDGASILSNCYDSPDPDPAICNLVTRSSSAQITSVTSGYVNAGYTRYRAWTFAATYAVPLQSLSRFFDPSARLDIQVNAVDTLSNRTSVSGMGYDLLESADSLSAPRWKGILGFAYRQGAVGVSWIANYVSASQYSTTATSETNDVLRVGSYWKHDAQITLDLKGGAQFRLGVNNVFNRSPDPRAVGGDGSVGSYDIIGRYLYVGLKTMW
jgi:outer membrane receptor protein involved in Fe transport